MLIFAAVMSLRFGDIGVVWKTSYAGKIGMIVTFGRPWRCRSRRPSASA